MRSTFVAERRDPSGSGAQDWPEGSRLTPSTFLAERREPSGSGAQDWPEGLRLTPSTFLAERREPSGSGAQDWPEGSRLTPSTFLAERREPSGSGAQDWPEGSRPAANKGWLSPVAGRLARCRYAIETCLFVYSAFSGTFSRISSNTWSASIPSACASKFNKTRCLIAGRKTRRTSSKLTL
ncbi:hypothetical protein FF011L_45610 [Roseimaritima multifibrata]|uniref:Uncharacterized protein n=1 Tax=Roseimaritima multifibrata TaxID=1930274 RepID=A0A517MLM8_9BACT|nr:hypothetical protein FF011L_45610 [Roseimaritima multifibrata]